MKFHTKFVTDTRQILHFILHLYLCVIHDIFEIWRHKPKWDSPQLGQWDQVPAEHVYVLINKTMGHVYFNSRVDK